METAAKNVHDLTHVAESSTVHRLQTNTINYEGDNSKTACYRCGRNHSPDVCWFKNATCNLCGKTGHIEPVCKSSNQPQSEMFRSDHDRKWRSGNGRNVTSQSKTHHLQEGGSDEQCYTMYTIDSCYAPKEDRIIESFTIQDQVIDLELDTGASVSVIKEKQMSIHEGENGCPGTCSKWSRDSTMYRKGGSNSECSSSFQCHRIKGVLRSN